jgi:iron complex outermembrane receptor protein
MHYSILRSDVSVAAIVVALWLPAVAQAQARIFNVPAQSASSDIRVFAQQAGIQVIVAGRDTDGHSTNAVQSSIDTRAALGQLLSATGLSSTLYVFHQVQVQKALLFAM